MPRRLPDDKIMRTYVRTCVLLEGGWVYVRKGVTVRDDDDVVQKAGWLNTGYEVCER